MMTGVSAGAVRFKSFNTNQPMPSAKATTNATASDVTPAAAHFFCRLLKSITMRLPSLARRCGNPEDAPAANGCRDSRTKNQKACGWR